MIKRWLRKIFLLPISPGVVSRLYNLKLVHTGKKPALSSLKDAGNILVVKQDVIGDAILLVPFLRSLRENAPKAHICIVANSITKSLWDSCPYVDECHYLDCDGNGLLNHYKNFAKVKHFARKELSGRDWDFGIIPRWGVDAYYSHYIPFFSKARQRIGFSESVTEQRAIWNRGYDELLTMAINARRVEHEAKQNLNIIRALSGRVDEQPITLWAHEMSEHAMELSENCSASIVVGMSPGARDARRRWPIDRLAVVGKKIQQDTGALIVVVGGHDAVEPGNQIMQACDSNTAINYAGQTDIIETIDILKQCNLFIGNDSAPMHMACLAGIPVIEISSQPENGKDSGTHSPVRFGPWSPGSVVMQPKTGRSPCSLECTAGRAHCICNVEVSDVYSHALKILRIASGRKSDHA